jgi:peptidoglycan/xylan/chitin deacetylase (PgdA/CDA1 family)
MYHDITEQPSRFFDLTPTGFREQMEQLKEAGARVVSLAELYDHLRSGKPLPPRAVALTFDDAYAGQLKAACPLMKEYGYAATFFVHTGAVGSAGGGGHLSWEQLRQLEREGLVSVQSHTLTHPGDLRRLDDEALARELGESKRVLEAALGHPVRFLAYPGGAADARVARAARAAGYEMAFTMGPGCAGPVEDAFLVPRVLPDRVPEVCARLREDALSVAFSARVLEWEPRELESGVLGEGAERVRWVRGGRPCGVRLEVPRKVPVLVDAAEAEAGINGAFFGDARVKSGAARVVGPVLTRYGSGFSGGIRRDRRRAEGRPLVLISPEKIMILPYSPHLAGDFSGVQRLLPGTVDCFVAGAWLVHDGRPVSRDLMGAFHLEDVLDARPRSFFGVDGMGRPVLGACSTGLSADRLAQALGPLGLREGVLLDSGSSTELVLGGEVLVAGRGEDGPRPVPHALLLLSPDREPPPVADGCSVGPPKLAALLRREEEADGAPSLFLDETLAVPPRRRDRGVP